MLQTKLLDGNLEVCCRRWLLSAKSEPFHPLISDYIQHAVFRQFIATSREISSMFVKCLFVCSTDKCDCDSYFLTTTKTEHSRILKYEMGIFSEIVRLIYSSEYFFKVTHFNRDITL